MIAPLLAISADLFAEHANLKAVVEGDGFRAAGIDQWIR
jgi:hypothetical protein